MSFRALHTHTNTHTHDDSIRRNAMRCVSPKNSWPALNGATAITYRLDGTSLVWTDAFLTGHEFVWTTALTGLQSCLDCRLLDGTRVLFGLTPWRDYSLAWTDAFLMELESCLNWRLLDGTVVFFGLTPSWRNWSLVWTDTSVLFGLPPSWRDCSLFWTDAFLTELESCLNWH